MGIAAEARPKTAPEVDGGRYLAKRTAPFVRKRLDWLIAFHRSKRDSVRGETYLVGVC